LVVKIAFEYKDLGLPLLDLISAGNMGLTKAVGKYNPDKGAKFSTYAGWWIKQSIKKMLSDESRVVRVPIYIIHLSNGARKARSEFKEAYGREPSDEEVAGIIDVSPEKLQEVSEVISTKYCSLDAPLGHDTENTVGSVIEDDNAQIPGSGGLDDIQRDVMKHLDRLTEREKYVLTKRFGLDNTKTVSLEVLGQRFGITRERVRQIQNQALAKLRSIMEKRNRIECDPTHPFRK
jgi:RNA polymerase primary sigma factor